MFRSYQSCHDEGIIDANSAPQCPFRDQSRKHRQGGSDEKNPSDDINVRPEEVP